MKIQAFALITAMIAASAFAQPNIYVPNEFAVTIKAGESVTHVVEDFNAEIVASYPSRRLYLLRIIPPVTSDDDEVEIELEGNRRCEASERNSQNAVADGNTQSFFVRTAPATFTDQPAWRTIGLPKNQRPGYASAPIIAVLDTGVSLHPDIASRVRPDGASFIIPGGPTNDVPAGLDSNGDGIVDQLAGHGTFVAGIINHIAPTCQILPVQVLDSDGVGTSFSVAAGIYYAIDMHAKVINLSLSSPVESSAIRAAVNAALDAGIAVVCAAGNNGGASPVFPASVPGVIAVTSVDNSLHAPAWADYGPAIAFSAPGVDITSTFWDGTYVSNSGTSASCAFVSATFGAVSAQFPMLSTSNVTLLVWRSGVSIDSRNPAQAGQLGRMLNVSRLIQTAPFSMKALP